MVDSYTIKDVTNDLRFMLTLTNLFTADDQGFWYLNDTEERYKHKLDNNDQGKEIVLIQDPMPRGDFLVFNPFSETYGKQNPATTFYYKTIRVSFNQTLKLVFFHVARTILASKEAAGKKEEYVVSPAVVRMSSLPTGKRQTLYDIVDEDMIKEFMQLFKHINDSLIHVPYYTQTMSAKATCEALSDPQWDAKYATKDIRKRSVAAFKSLLMGILGITKPEELSQFTVKYDPELKSAPRFHATMSVYLKLYSRFNDVVADAYVTDGVQPDQFIIDLGQLAETIERFPLAYAIGKHMMQPTVSTVKPTEVTTSDTSGLRFGQAGNNQNNANQGKSRFAGAPMIDGFGRIVPQGQVPQQQQMSSMTFNNPPATGGKFQPHVLSNTPPDPFAPATKVVPSMGSGSLGMNTQPFGGSIFTGGQGGMSFNSGGFGSSPFNFDPPSNFGQPGTNRWFPS